MRTNRTDTYVHPLAVFRLVASIIKTKATEFLKSVRFKVTREGWITAIFLIALSRYDGRNWYLRPNQIDEAPDFYVVSYKSEQDYQIELTRNIEVFELRNDSENDLIDSIVKKIDKTIYPTLTLVCYIEKGGLLPSPKDISDRVKQLKPRVMDIWCVGLTDPSRKYAVFQVYPEPLWLEIDLNEVEKEKEMATFIYPHRGKGVDLEPMGEMTLLTEDFFFHRVS